MSFPVAANPYKTTSTADYSSTSSGVQSNLRRPIGVPTRGVILNAPDLEDCASDSNELQAITVTVTGVNAVADVLVQLSFPARMIMVASIGPSQPMEARSLFLHLVPLGKQQTYLNSGTPTVITPDGTEPWFEIHNADLGTVSFKAMSYVKFRKPITKFYLDIGNEGGGANPRNYTFFCTNDIENVFLRTAGDALG